jgi:hypothetical protein
MANKAIIFDANRVVVGVTTEASPTLPAGFSTVDFNPDFTLAGGPWKLDAQNNKVAATLAEYRATGRDEAYNAQQEDQLLADFRTAAQAARVAWRAVANASGTPSAALFKAAATAQDDLNTATARRWKATLS